MTVERLYRPLRATAALVATAAALASGGCASSSKDQAVGYCAIMPDSVGLYVDNPVTQMGYTIGKIAAITPAAQSVRVDFIVNNGRVLPENVKAVTRSVSILADRSLALVGNYEAGPRLSAGGCIPLDRSMTPKSLSEAIGSSTAFINSINPAESNNVGEVVAGIDQALRNQGTSANKLLTTASTVLDSPDQAIGDLGSITTNLAQLSSTMAELEPMIKQVFIDTADSVAGEVDRTLVGTSMTFEGIPALTSMLGGIEKELGPQLQQLLDAVAVTIRKGTPRAPFYASLLNVAPRLINGLANLTNDHQFALHYRPPLYRLRTPDGVLQCNIMNASMPGSCANVQGTPFAVDVALLQYVLTQAANR